MSRKIATLGEIGWATKLRNYFHVYQGTHSDSTRKRGEEALSVAHRRLANSFIERLDWAACIDRYGRPHILLYFDLPYYETQRYACAVPILRV